MEAFIWIVLLGGILALWITAAAKLFRFGKSGVRYFLNYLFFMIVFAAILFVMIVAPVLDCTGFLCGLKNALVFAGLLFVQLITFPLIMLTRGLATLRSKAKEETKKDMQHDDLLDS